MSGDYRARTCDPLLVRQMLPARLNFHRVVVVVVSSLTTCLVYNKLRICQHIF